MPRSDGLDTASWIGLDFLRPLPDIRLARRSRSNWTCGSISVGILSRGRRLEEGQLGNLDVLLLRQQFCAALIEPALHIPERDLFA